MTMIAIYIRKTTGKGSKVYIDSKKNILNLIEQICKVFKEHNNDSENGLDLFFKGACISNRINLTLQQIGIEHNSIIHIVEKIFIDEEQLNFKFIVANQLLEYSIKADQSIHELKAMICANLRIPNENLTLSYLGAQLDNNLSIRDYHLTSNVLLSGLVVNSFTKIPHKKAQSVQPIQLQLLLGQSTEKIESEMLSKNNRLKKTQSQKLQSKSDQQQSPVKRHSSARFNQLLFKHEDTPVKIQIKEPQEQIREEILQNLDANQLEFNQTGQINLIGEPLFDYQKIVQTESIVGDDEEESLLSECLIQITRIDKMRHYVIQCSSSDTFEDAQAFVARLQHVNNHQIIFLLLFDEDSKSGILYRSANAHRKTSGFSEDLARQKSIGNTRFVSWSPTKIAKPESMKMKIVEKAARLKIKTMSFQFQVKYQ